MCILLPKFRIYIAIAVTKFGLCDALPIPTVPITGELNLFLISGLVLVSLIAVLAGCACCLRKKKGFEEFKNESESQRATVPSIAITEATASTDSTRSTTPAAVIISIPVVNNSNENLIVDDNDNNNGPISSTDLENIENNNAFNYIQNQNEIVGQVEEPTTTTTATVTTAAISRNRNFINNSNIDQTSSIISPSHVAIQMNEQYENHNYNNNHYFHNNNNNSNVLQDIAITSTNLSHNIDSRNSSLSTTSPNNDNSINKITSTNLNNSNIISVDIHTFDDDDDEHQNYQLLNQIPKTNDKCIDKDVPIIFNNIDDVTLCNDIEYLKHDKLEQDCLVTTTPKTRVNDGDSISIKSVSSDKSNEISSVEEALRVLDNAIEDGDDDDDGTCNDNADYIVDHFIHHDNNNDNPNEFIVALIHDNKSTNENFNDDDDDTITLTSPVIEDLNNDETACFDNDDDQHQQQQLQSSYDENSDKIKIIPYENCVNHVDDDNIRGNDYLDIVRSEAEDLVNNILNERKRIVEQEAIVFVDSLLNDSQKFIEEKILNEQQEQQQNGPLQYDENCINIKTDLQQQDEQLNSLPSPPQQPTTIAINYFTIETNLNPNEILLNGGRHEFDDMMLMKKQKQLQQQQFKTEINKNNHNNINFKQKLAESLDDFFTSDSIASSTPCIEKKYIENATRKNGIKLQFDNVIVNEKLPSNVNKDLTTLDCIENYNNMNGTYTANATYKIDDLPYENNETFDINKTIDKTYELNNDDYTFPGDPCTSKQAIERDQFLRPLIKYQREEITSDDLNTITPVNTPIELNYNQETWDKMTKPNNDEEQLKSGWFLHPQQQFGVDVGAIDDLDENPLHETYDVDEEDSRNLESTFEALRKQLAEVLPQPQGMAGPLEFSDDDDADEQHSNRTFDEYRSPLDGLFNLLEIENAGPPLPAQNEVVINYKRSLSPIIEESEEETYKTFVMNETKCLDSTSTGCVETGEAIMGVTKTLMASNDTLFNFEDTLGDKDDNFSPRISSRSDSQATTPVKSIGRSTGTSNSSIATTISSSDTEKPDYQNDSSHTHPIQTITAIQQLHQPLEKSIREPPKTLSFVDASELKPENDFCSPDQPKTFSEGTSTSTTTDRLSSSLSPTLDNETTFTMNTIDDKTCITVIIKDDERISEISEPEWGESTASCNIVGVGVMGTNVCDMNSLTDVSSLDFNVNTFDKEFEMLDAGSNDIDNNLRTNETKLNGHINGNIDDDENTDNGNEEIAIDDIEIQKDSGHDDSGHSTQASTDKSNNTSHNISAQETDSIKDENICVIKKETNESSELNFDKKEYCKEFIQNEIEFSSTNQKYANEEKELVNDDQHENDEIIYECSKENSDPNVTVKKNSLNCCIVVNNGFVENVCGDGGDVVVVDGADNNDLIADNKMIPNQKLVQMNTKNQGNVINDKTSEFIENVNGIDFYPKNSIVCHKKSDLINITSSSSLSSSTSSSSTTNQYDVVVINGSTQQAKNFNDNECIVQLSGEEDPWAESLNELKFSGPCGATNEILSSSFNNSNSSEWDSDVDDSHSSEEFMYVSGTLANKDILQYIKQNNDIDEFENKGDFYTTSNANKTSMIKEVGEDEEEVEITSEGSSSEFEGEFVPSCWDSMAMPARSALKSPDKNSSSEEDSQGESKKSRNVVFKKQRYHSVYEYPRENLSLSPSFGGPNLWNNSHYKNYHDDKMNMKFNDDGFIISCTSRPFHGSQFNACHTWPTDSDFSWSKIETQNNFGNDSKKLVTYSDIDIKWPQQTSLTNDEVDSSDTNKTDESVRPDSGVGESAEMLSDRQSLGELCHTKNKLRLPIEGLLNKQSSSSSSSNELPENDNSDFLLLPASLLPTTPSCTGSMDSLSSSSSINSELLVQQQHHQQQQNHEQQQDQFQQQQQQPNQLLEQTKELSFSTFGKRNLITTTTTTNIKRPIENSDRKNQIIFDDKPAINSLNDKMKLKNFNLNQISCNNLLLKTSDKIKQSDSTDEDSGIESIMKIHKIV